MVVIYLIVAALVFALLYWLITFIGSKLPGNVGGPFVMVGQIFLAVCAVLLLIFLLLSFVNGQPLFKP